MKKLMIALAAVATAAIANAASINWGTSTSLADPSGNPADGSGYITMYLFSIDSTAYASLTAGGEAGVAAKVWSTYGSNLATATDSYPDDGMGQIFLADPNSYGVNETAYAAIILTYDEGAGVTHYIGNAASFTFAADIDKEVADLDAFVGGDVGAMSTPTGWAAVPEPTSGLLMLLGMAGLALRRRRA